MTDRPRERALVLAVAVGIDLVFGEPTSRLHPVNWLGAAITGLDRVAPRSGRIQPLLYGACSLLGVTCLVVATAGTAERLVSRLPGPIRVLALALMLKPAFATRMLLQTAAGVEDGLASNNIARAQQQLAGLVSRESSSLSPPECAAAAIESLAENTTDSIIGPWLGYALFGLPGAWAFRTTNTFDSRWGYHGEYEWLGRAAAKVDDVLAFLPARVSAILLIAGMRLTCGKAGAAITTLRRDRRLTESPNAGWTMSAMAGGLGIRLSKRGGYELNAQGRAATAADIGRARQAVACAAALGCGLFMASRLFTTGRRRSSDTSQT
jgi:adenosylcobinamide-phosphate synthase